MKDISDMKRQIEAMKALLKNNTCTCKKVKEGKLGSRNTLNAVTDSQVDTAAELVNRFTYLHKYGKSMVTPIYGIFRVLSYDWLSFP